MDMGVTSNAAGHPIFGSRIVLPNSLPTVIQFLCTNLWYIHDPKLMIKKKVEN